MDSLPHNDSHHFQPQLRLILSTSQPCAIDRLTDDILKDVFLRFDPNSSHEHKETRKAWWSIPIVCRRWRHLALSLPRYWSSLLFIYAKTTQVMLSRSQQLPLEIDFPGTASGYSYGANIVLVAECLDRVTVIKNMSFMKDLRAFIQAASKPALSMRVCALRMVDVPGNTDLCVSKEFLSGDAPRLEELVLRGCYISWKSPLIHAGIHTLHLLSQRSMPNEDVNTILDVLARMPRLQDLRLGSGLPTVMHLTEGLDPASDRSVRLPCLAALHLTGEPFDVGGFLLLLEVPYDTSTHLSLVLTSTNIGEALDRPFYTDAEAPAHVMAPLNELGLTVARHFAGRFASPATQRMQEQPQPNMLQLCGAWPADYAVRAAYVPTQTGLSNLALLPTAWGDDGGMFPQPAPPGGFAFSLATQGPRDRSGHMRRDPFLRACPFALSGVTMLNLHGLKVTHELCMDVTQRVPAVQSITCQRIPFMDIGKLLGLVAYVNHGIDEDLLGEAAGPFPGLEHLALACLEFVDYGTRWNRRRRFRTLNLYSLIEVPQDVLAHLRGFADEFAVDEQ